MRKIINSTYITLDGVVDAAQLWPSSGRLGDDRAGRIESDLLLSCDALVMGRHTYDGFAPVWPTRSDPAADHNHRDRSTSSRGPWRTRGGRTRASSRRRRRRDRAAQAGVGRGHRPVRVRGGDAADARARPPRRAAALAVPADPRPGQAGGPAVRRDAHGPPRAHGHSPARGRHRDPRLPLRPIAAAGPAPSRSAAASSGALSPASSGASTSASAVTLAATSPLRHRPGRRTHRPGLGHAAPERRRRGESCRSHPGAHGRVRAFTLVAGVRVGGGCGA
jgi:hypothetical protein